MSPLSKETKVTFSVEGDVKNMFVFAAFGIIASSVDRVPQVRLEFENIDHPFVAVARAIKYGQPHDYLVVAPEGEPYVYLLSAEDEQFVLEEALLVRITAFGPMLESEILQQGALAPQEVVRWELLHRAKLPVARIWLRRDDGGFASAEWFREKTPGIWQAANQQLAAWAATAPADGSFHRVFYEVDYGEGKATFIDFYHLRNHDTQLANLGRILRRRYAPLPGRKLVPWSPISSDYSAMRARQFLADYAWELEHQIGLPHGWVDREVQLIRYGELPDGPDVQPVSWE